MKGCHLVPFSRTRLTLMIWKRTAPLIQRRRLIQQRIQTIRLQVDDTEEEADTKEADLILLLATKGCCWIQRVLLVQLVVFLTGRRTAVLLLSAAISSSKPPGQLIHNFQIAFLSY